MRHLFLPDSRPVRTGAWLRPVLLVCVFGLGSVSPSTRLAAQAPADHQMGEQIVPEAQARRGAPKRRGPAHPWIELSNLRKGKELGTLEVDYRVTAGDPGVFTLSLGGENQGFRWAISVPVAREKAGTFVIRGTGAGGDLEAWAQLDGYKLSRSVTMGKISQITFAREWSEQEKADYLLEQKRIAAPPPPPEGWVVLDGATSPLLPGMPVLGTWMGAWREAELLQVEGNCLSVRWAQPPPEEPLLFRSPLDRNRIAVSNATLARGRAAPGDFRPSERLLEGGAMVLPDTYVPLTADVPLVPGTPLKREWNGKLEPVLVLGDVRGRRVPILQDDDNRRRDEMWISQLAIALTTLQRLREPGAKEFYADQLRKLEQSTPKGQVRRFPIRPPYPQGTIPLANDLVVAKGTKLQVSFAAQWYVLLVLNDSREGEVECQWNPGTGKQNLWITRDSVVISETEEARLRARMAGKEEPGSAPPPDGVDGSVPVPRFVIVLEGVPTNKRVAVAKVIMKICDVELKGALERCNLLPNVLTRCPTEAEAKGFQKKIEAAGGKASIKSE